MKKFSALALVWLAACSPTPTAFPATVPVSSDAPIAITAPLQDVIPTIMIRPTATHAPDTSASLRLQILSPLDEAVVDVPQVDVIGSAPAGTVISLDEQIFIVGSDQQFKATVPLAEGPNLIEIVASDQDGNETSALLTVTYEP